MGRLIDADVAIESLTEYGNGRAVYIGVEEAVRRIEQLPSAKPFHIITMTDVMKYIDGMPEDIWQEFVACLECRGWELQRRTAKWCGGDFA